MTIWANQPDVLGAEQFTVFVKNLIDLDIERFDLRAALTAEFAATTHFRVACLCDSCFRGGVAICHGCASPLGLGRGQVKVMEAVGLEPTSDFLRVLPGEPAASFESERASLEIRATLFR